MSIASHRAHELRAVTGPRPFSGEVCARFWSKVDKGDGSGCWLWVASTTSGYGQIGVDGDVLLAHRIAYEMTHGIGSAAGLVVRHRCDVRRCCRPDHLVIGTNADNVADRVERGRSASKLTPEQAREIATCGGRQSAVAARFGVTQGTVSQIRNGRTWSHVTGIGMAA